jgi:hypothetical protein
MAYHAPNKRQYNITKQQAANKTPMPISVLAFSFSTFRNFIYALALNGLIKL